MEGGVTKVKVMLLDAPAGHRRCYKETLVETNGKTTFRMGAVCVAPWTTVVLVSTNIGN